MQLTSDPIPFLMKKIAIPTSIGFFFHTMFNVVDTFFAGQISTEALGGLSLSFPIYFGLLAFSIGLGQGATSLLSNAFGARKEEDAKQIFYQALTLGVILSLILTVCGYVFSPFLFRLLGAQEKFLHLSLEYMNTIVFGSVFFLIQNVFNAALSALGETKPFRNVLIFGFFANMLLNQIFIFGIGSWQGFGVQGLALSTILIQMGGALYLFHRLKKMNFWKNYKLSEQFPLWHVQKQILGQGLPAILNMLTIAIGSFTITYFVGRFGGVAVAAYGAAIRIEQIILIPTVGFNSAVLTLTGQNNGANKPDRIWESWVLSMKIGCSLMIAGGIVLFFFSEHLLALFSKDLEVINIGKSYLHYASFILAAYVIMFSTNSLLQGLKHPKFPVFMGTARQFIAPLIAFPILSSYFELEGIWISIVIITWISAIITVVKGKSTLTKIFNEQEKKSAT